MYKSPDLVKVDLYIKDNFAAYPTCTPDEGGFYNQHLGKCNYPDDGTQYVFTQLGWGAGCFTTHNGPT